MTAKRCYKCEKSIRSNRHVNSRVCRSAQVELKMRRAGLHPLPISLAKRLHRLGIDYERVPSTIYGGGQRPKAWGHKNRHAYSGPLYEGLSDQLFVSQWVRVILCAMHGRAIRNMFVFCGDARTDAKLCAVNKETNEYKQALETIFSIGGRDGVDSFLEGDL